jgi:hypothetical protein
MVDLPTKKAIHFRTWRSAVACVAWIAPRQLQTLAPERLGQKVNGLL